MTMSDSDVLAGPDREYLLGQMERTVDRFGHLPKDDVIAIMKDTVRIVFESQRLSKEFRRSKAE